MKKRRGGNTPTPITIEKLFRKRTPFIHQHEPWDHDYTPNPKRRKTYSKEKKEKITRISPKKPI